MIIKELQSVINNLLPSERRHYKVVVVMPDDATVVYDVQGTRLNAIQQTLEILIA